MVAAAAAIAAAAVAGSAFADGDPASDYLVGQSVFAPYDRNVPTADAGQLTLLVQKAQASGYRIRVALIGAQGDLGAITSLWRKPKQYARFLSQELFYVYKGELLVVMPNGYGIARTGKPVPAEQKQLAALPVPRAGIANLPVAATTAVTTLAAARGLHLSVPSASAGASRENHDRLTIVAFVVAAMILAVAIELGRKRLRVRRAARAERG